MKRRLIASLMTMFAGVALAQSPTEPPAQAELAGPKPEPRTKLEAVDERAGSIFVKGFTSIGKFGQPYYGTIEVEALRIVEEPAHEVTAGVRFTLTRGGSLPQEQVGFVDYDELDSLVAGLDYIAKATRDAGKLQQFEATYRTKAGLEFTTFSSDDKIKFAIQGPPIGRATVITDLANITKLRDLIVQARTKLDAIEK